MFDTTKMDATEPVADRITRLALTDISAARLETLTIAHGMDVSDSTFVDLGNAMRVAREDTIVLPPHRFEGLSRGRGWCRQGRGDTAIWGERTDKGYRVGPGKWTVGGNDGFARKGEDSWVVKHIQVGGETWTVAD